MTCAAVNLFAPRAGSEAFSAEDMEAIVADVITFSRVKAGFAGKRIEGFQYRVIRQGKSPRFLAPLHRKPKNWADGFNANEGNRFEQEINAEFPYQILNLTLQLPLNGFNLTFGTFILPVRGRFFCEHLAVFVNKSLIVIMDAPDI